METKHPSPFGHRLEEAVLGLLGREGWDPGSGRVDDVTVSLMSSDPEAVRRFAETVPSRHVCQLARNPTRRTDRGGLRVGSAAAAPIRHGGHRKRTRSSAMPV